MHISERTAERARETVDAVYRSESRRVLATLIRLLGDFDLAEDALQDAFAAALTQWQTFAGTVLAGVDSGGGIFSGPAGALARISASAANLSDVPMKARGAFGQSANLHEWQDNSGNILTKVTSNGSVTIVASGAAFFPLISITA